MQAFGVGGAVVGELHLYRHHVGVGAEGLAAEAVLHRQALPRDPVQQLVVFQRAGWRDGLRAEERRSRGRVGVMTQEREDAEEGRLSAYSRREDGVRQGQSLQVGHEAAGQVTVDGCDLGGGGWFDCEEEKV